MTNRMNTDTIIEKKHFASDNHSGVHPAIFKAMEAANQGDSYSYGDDPYTAEAEALFKHHLGDDIAVFFVFNGTGANVLGLKAITRPYNAVIAAHSAHLQVDECGAPENFTGCKIKLIDTPDGKLTVPAIEKILKGRGDQHHVQSKVVSITQASELGTVYRPEEIKQIADFLHQRGMLLHMDGSRIANAAASLGLPLKAFTTQCNVDVLSFGGTKNGMMMGEAVVFFDKESPAAREFIFIRKQGMQLYSKMRFIGAQYMAYFNDDLWLKNATHANAMAKLLESKVKRLSTISIIYPVESNALFIKMPTHLVKPLQDQYFFYEWSDYDESSTIVRWMCSFDTMPEDIEGFVKALEKVTN